MRPVFYGFMESSGVLPLGAAQQQRQLGGGQSGQGLHGHSGRGSGQILHRGRSWNSRDHRAAAIAAGVAGIAAAAIVAGVPAVAGVFAIAGVLTIAGVFAVTSVHTVIFVVIVVVVVTIIVVIIFVGLVVRLRILAGQGAVAGAVLAVAGVGVVALIKARGALGLAVARMIVAGAVGKDAGAGGLGQHPGGDQIADKAADVVVLFHDRFLSLYSRYPAVRQGVSVVWRGVFAPCGYRIPPAGHKTGKSGQRPG